MPFSQKVKEEALVRSRRCCCVCQEFAGRDINTHHIVQEVNGGSNDLENAIVLCLRCHSEAGHYNPQHPLGNKYSPDELRRHRDGWWEWCESNPATPMPKHPIALSPGIIIVADGEWSSKATIKLYNSTDRVYYQIFMKVGFDRPDAHTECIRIEPSDTSLVEDLAAAVGEATVNPHVIRFDGIDSSGSKVIFLQLYSLDPGNICTFVLSSKLPSESSAEGPLRAFISICAFEEEPASVLQGAEKVAIQFRPPEDFKLTGFSLWMKRDT